MCIQNPGSTGTSGGVGFGVSGFGFRVSGFRVQGLGTLLHLQTLNPTLNPKSERARRRPLMKAPGMVTRAEARTG